MDAILKASLPKLREKLLEALQAVLPIAAIVLVLCFTIAPVSPSILLCFLHTLISFLLELLLALSHILQLFLTSFCNVFRQRVGLCQEFLILLLEFFVSALHFILIFLRHSIKVSLSFGKFRHNSDYFLRIHVSEFSLRHSSQWEGEHNYE